MIAFLIGTTWFIRHCLLNLVGSLDGRVSNDEFVESINQFFKYFPGYKSCKLVPLGIYSLLKRSFE